MTAPNPFLLPDPEGGPRPLCELKLSLVFYTDYPPGPNRARRVYDRYMARFGTFIREYKPTGGPLMHGPPLPWDGAARAEFEASELPTLQQVSRWGYGFASGQKADSHLFMFHGYKPASEPGKASFFRFEWPWDTAHEVIFAFATEVAEAVPFLSGTGGYILQARPHHAAAYDYAYAKAQRYWGLEAWNLDATVSYVLDGYKCPSWLTLVGNKLLEKKGQVPGLDDLASHRTSALHGSIFRSREAPDVIDRNYAAPYPVEQLVARVLEPIQIAKHAPFGGTRWDADNTREWLRRFQ